MIAPGERLTVNWVAPAGRRGAVWVSLFRVGDPNTEFGPWAYTNGASTGTVMSMGTDFRLRVPGSRYRADHSEPVPPPAAWYP